MTVVALAAFVTIEDKDGGDPAPFEDFDGQTITTSSSTGLNKFQNGRHQEISGYKYLSFIYQGAAMNRSGDNLEASLILANSPLSMAYAKEFIAKKYYFLVETFLMNDDFSSKDTAVANGGRISGEYWLAAGMRYDQESIEITLSSPIDAVGANAPQQTLTKRRCAHLPLTGQVQNL
tara:strand:- start:1409 stop:1939 length:531 start_codon:yes stop_codon:yes gene_type:complete